MAVASRSMLPVHPITLKFVDSSWERGYQKHQQQHHASIEPSLLNWHIISGFVQLSTSAYLANNGKLFTWFSARSILPYTCATITHRLLASKAVYKDHRTAFVLLFEALYVAFCIDGLPNWVLSDVIDVKTFYRDLLLGSGFLLAYWFTFFSHKPFSVDLIAIPVHFMFLMVRLTGPTCKILEGTARGQATSRRLSALLDSMAAASMLACPTHSCANILYVWYAVLCAVLLYARYAVEWHRRARFAAPMRLGNGWPAVPPVYSAVLQMAAAVQLLTVLWAALQCSSMPHT